MEDRLITVITPTYNRGEQLKDLYISLCNQTNKNFRWLIIDDGSVDDTRNSIVKFQSEKKIAIDYMYEENGGKHRALNLGIKNIHEELTFIVDSDDVLPPDSIEIILRYHEKYKQYNSKAILDNKREICGYSFLRCHEDGTVNTAYFPQNEIIDSYCNVRINGNIGGDKAEVFYTNILKEYPFKEYDNEKFMPEDAVWMLMSEKYDMVHINENVYICEYLDGGLTKSGRGMKIKSPRGMMYRSEIYLKYKGVNFKTRIKMMLLLIIYSKYAKESAYTISKDISNKVLVLYFISVIPGNFLYLRWIKHEKR